MKDLNMENSEPKKVDATSKEQLFNEIFHSENCYHFPKLKELVFLALTEHVTDFKCKLFERIQHGDDEHRAWLKNEMDEFLKQYIK